MVSVRDLAGVRARVLEIKLDEAKLKLGLKESYFDGDGEEDFDGQRMAAEEDEAADLDEDMLDAAEVDSEGDDWRQAALESPEGSAAEGEQAKIHLPWDLKLQPL